MRKRGLRWARGRVGHGRWQSQVSWLPTIRGGAGGVLVPQASLSVFPILQPNSVFGTNYQSRLGPAQDEVNFRRIVGRLRLGLYLDDLTNGLTVGDFPVYYGVAMVKGEYDGAGNWTVNVSDIPTPAESQDDPEKWLFRDVSIFTVAPQETFVQGGILISATQLTRAQYLSTDQQGPNFSWVDIKTRRKTSYEEKPCIVVHVIEDFSSIGALLYLNHDLRVLVKKGRI